MKPLKIDRSIVTLSLLTMMTSHSITTRASLDR